MAGLRRERFLTFVRTLMKRPKNFSILLPVALLLCLQICLAGLFFRDEYYLSGTMNTIADSKLPPSEQTLKILEYLKDLPIESNESYFLTPAFRFLRATPRQIAEEGGDCADRSRLVIALLQTRGIYASKWALYSPKLHPAHAVVEVYTEQGKMAVDPLFGLWFPRPQGGYYSVEDLRKHGEILRQRVRYLQEHHLRPGAADLNGYPLNTYIYGLARSINWDKSAVPYMIYRGLHAIIGDRANHLPRPEWVETPALVLIVCIGILQAFFLFVWVLRFFWKMRAAPRFLGVPFPLRKASRT